METIHEPFIHFGAELFAQRSAAFNEDLARLAEAEPWAHVGEQRPFRVRVPEHRLDAAVACVLGRMATFRGVALMPNQRYYERFVERLRRDPRRLPRVCSLLAIVPAYESGGRPALAIAVMDRGRVRKPGRVDVEVIGMVAQAVAVMAEHHAEAHRSAPWHPMSVKLEVAASPRVTCEVSGPLS